MMPYRGPPLKLGDAAAANLQFMVWCKACRYRSEPDPGEQARWYGPETPVPEPRMGPTAGLLAMRQQAGRFRGDRRATITPHLNHHHHDTRRYDHDRRHAAEKVTQRPAAVTFWRQICRRFRHRTAPWPELTNGQLL